MSEPPSIVRTILIRIAGEVLLADAPPHAEPLLVEALLDTLCELLDAERRPVSSPRLSPPRLPSISLD